MSIKELSRPYAKHQRQSPAITFNAIPIHPHNLSHHQPHHHHSSYCNEQSGPMNLVTTSTVYSTNSHSQLPSTLTQFNDDSNRCLSSSSMVDIENDCSLSPVSIPLQQQKSHTNTTVSSMVHKMLYDAAGTTAEQCSVTSAAAITAAAYPFNYTHLYASRAALYGAPVNFPAHNPGLISHADVMRSHATYLNAALPPHPTVKAKDASVFSAAYIKAIQNVAKAAGIFNATAHEPSELPSMRNANTPPCKPNPRNSTGPILALAPSGATMAPNASYSSSTSLKNQTPAEQKNDTLISSSPAVPKLTSGTYLNDKVNTAPVENDAENYFKVPSGKEGSLKHRILTRPASSEKCDGSRASVMRTYNTTSNFKKGSYIELSSGVLRRVEDMRTEDFIQSAERSPLHQLAESTVVKINTSLPYSVVITFNYDKNRSKADIEVSSEHPFFVYGQGWASCNPELSLKVYGLKCQRLQVGDICISLTKREHSSRNKQSHLTDIEKNSKLPTNQTSPSNHASCENTGDAQVTQSRSRELHPQSQPLMPDSVSPTTLSNYLSISMTPLIAAQYPAVPMHLLPTSTHLYTDMAQMVHHASLARPEDAITNSVLHLSPTVMNSFYQQSQHLYQQQNENTSDLKSIQALQLSRPPTFHNVQHYYESPPMLPNETNAMQSRLSNCNGLNSTEQYQSLDAAISRKRRWSAPESICDDDAECQPLRHQHAATPETSTNASSCKSLTTLTKTLSVSNGKSGT